METVAPSWEAIGEDSLSLFDNFIHENYGAPSSDMGEVILCRDEDTFAEFRTWVQSSVRPLAFDTENTGLYQYETGFERKLLQWGDASTSYVFVEGDPWYARSIDYIMAETDMRLLAHNVAYDALVLDSGGYVDAMKLMERCHDTYIFAHLVDPRGVKEGGIGHKLSQLSWAYVDETAPDSDKALKNLFRSMGWKISNGEGYRKIPKTHPTLVQYAGIDTIQVARLYPVLVEKVKAMGMSKLVPYEHRLQMLCAVLERRGILVNAEYGAGLYDSFDDRRREYLEVLAHYGVVNPEAAKQVVAALQRTGEVLTDTTKSGALQVDKKVLEAIIGREGEGAKLAAAIIGAKNSAKWREAYVGNTLKRLDDAGRVHPKINSLMARTARMSVGEPPLQQIPSGLADIRHMYMAEPGCHMASVDFSGVELRVLAALSKDEVMLRAFRRGDDLHQITADSANVPRPVGKMTNFAKVFGGGAKTIARQAGVSIHTAETVVKGFNKTYKGVGRYSHQLSSPIEAGLKKHITTYSGRRLPVDADRPYSALNYMVQSTARDVLGKAMIHVWKAGLWDYVVLPIHDELLCSIPDANAEEVCKEIAVLMECELEGLRLETEPDIGGNNWGTLYEKREGAHKVLKLTEEDRVRYGGRYE